MALSGNLKRAVIVGALGAMGLAASARQDRLLLALAPDAPQAPVAVPDRPAQPVRVTVVSFAALEQAQTFTGTVRPRHEAALGFRLPGKIVARLVEVGDRVTAGQPLARIDDTDVRLDLAATRAEVTAVRTDLARARAEAQGTQGVFANGHVAQAALDRATSTKAAARSPLDRSERAAALAENRLAYTTLTTDTEGVVTEAPGEVGQVLAAGQPAVAVARMDALDVVFALPEQDRRSLEDAQASAILWGAADQPYALVLRDISPVMDPASRTYRVRMAVSAPDATMALRLRPRSR